LDGFVVRVTVRVYGVRKELDYIKLTCVIARKIARYYKQRKQHVKKTR